MAGKKQTPRAAEAVSPKSKEEPHMPLEIGQRVKQVVPVIAGEVTDVRYDAQAKSFAYLIDFASEGETHQRWFTAAEVEPAESTESEG